jgi:hypothetical protein
MTNTSRELARLSDAELLAETIRLARTERDATVALIRCLIEVEARRLHLAQGRSSLFTYCTQVLHLSEHAAYRRIEAARTARRFPRILELVADGSINLTTVGLVAPHLTAENIDTVLDRVRGKSKRDVEAVVAALRPSPDVPATVRKLPAPTVSAVLRDTHPSGASSSAAVPTDETAAVPGIRHPEPGAPRLPAVHAAQKLSVVAPLAPGRYKLQLTVSTETQEKLRRLQDLTRHTNPTGDLAVILDRAITLLLEHVERQKLAATDRPRTGADRSSQTRHVPAGVKRAVWKRDEGRCAFIGPDGRCGERAFLEFHHVVPFADGGIASVESISLRCRAHNGYEAERWFGAPWILRDSPSGSDSTSTSRAVEPDHWTWPG